MIWLIKKLIKHHCYVWPNLNQLNSFIQKILGLIIFSELWNKIELMKYVDNANVVLTITEGWSNKEIDNIFNVELLSMAQ